MRELVIGTRSSSLALCQTELVKAQLEQRAPGRRLSVQRLTSHADRNPELALAAMGGEGVFVKELEVALLERRIDVAVHSLKDLPLDVPRGLCIAAVLKREEPRDALISRSGAVFAGLASGARVGTSSLRRRSQLLRCRRDLRMLEIRGNVDTRLRKVAEGTYDAIVLAAAGLIRLGLKERITELFPISVMVPEPGQGALALEARGEDREVLEFLGGLNEPVSRACVEAERAFLRELGGGCRVPIAAYASYQQEVLTLEGTVVAADGSAQLRGTRTGAMAEAVAIGKRLGQELIAQGALDLL